ncbi:unnamed protein product [Paramecium sonneborni]|uniref:FH2 domain-containing protein n=1 Tax=Paramecium sonneborni TaxID=65129 RepID=A0A8S1K7L5_9CILI|nr:unnamed protein product [Paramecium sonneborni]
MGNEFKLSTNETQYSYMFQGKQLNIKNLGQPPKFQINVDNLEEIFDQILSYTNLEKKKFLNLNLKQKQLLLILHYQALIYENPMIQHLNSESDLLIYIQFYQEIKTLKSLNDEILNKFLIAFALPIAQKQIEFLSLNKNILNIFDKLYVLQQCNLLFLEFILDELQLITLTNNLQLIFKLSNSQIQALIYQQYEKISWRQINGYQLVEQLLKKQNQDFCLLSTISLLETSTDKKLIAIILSFINNFVELSNDKIQLKQLLLVHGVELIFQEIKKKINDKTLIFYDSYSKLVGANEYSNEFDSAILKNITAFETLLESYESNVRESINQFRISCNPKSLPLLNRVSIGKVQLAQVVFPEQFLLNLQSFSAEIHESQSFNQLIKNMQNFLSEAEVLGKNFVTTILQKLVQNCVIEYNSKQAQIEDLRRQLHEFQEQKIQFQKQLKQTSNILRSLKEGLLMYDKNTEQLSCIQQESQVLQLDKASNIQMNCSLQIQLTDENKLLPVQTSCSLPIQKIIPQIPQITTPPPPPPPPPPPQKTFNNSNKIDIRKRRQPTQLLQQIGITEIKQMKSKIFSILDDSKIQLQFEELDKHFQKNLNKTNIPTTSQIIQKKSSVLTLDRSRNIELILVKIKISMVDIINYIKEMNYKKFTSDDIESIIQTFPTIQEIEELKKIQDTTALNRPELFLFNLIRIENYQEKILVFSILLNPNQNEILKQLELIQEQVQSIQQNVKFQKLLCYILAGINYLNSSSNKDSYGFKLSEFSKIVPLKSNNSSKINFLNLIIKMAEKQEGELILEEEYNVQKLKQLSKISIVNIQKQIEKLEQDDKLIMKYLDILKVDNFGDKNQQNLKELYSKVSQQFYELCEGFCEDPKKLDTDYFFTQLTQMIENLIEQKKLNIIIEEELQRKKAIDQINSYFDNKSNSQEQEITKQEDNIIKQIEERKSYKQQVQEMKFRSLKSLTKLKKNIKQMREQTTQ